MGGNACRNPVELEREDRLFLPTEWALGFPNLSLALSKWDQEFERLNWERGSILFVQSSPPRPSLGVYRVLNGKPRFFSKDMERIRLVRHSVC